MPRPASPLHLDRACVDGAGRQQSDVHHRALDFEARGLRERLVKVKDAEGKSFDHGEFEIVVEAAVGAEALADA